MDRSVASISFLPRVPYLDTGHCGQLVKELGERWKLPSQQPFDIAYHKYVIAFHKRTCNIIFQHVAEAVEVFAAIAREEHVEDILSCAGIRPRGASPT